MWVFIWVLTIEGIKYELACAIPSHGEGVGTGFVSRIYIYRGDSPGLRFAGPPSLRVPRKEGFFKFNNLFPTLFPPQRREGRRVKRCRGEYTR
jgi:hypothetical protein